MRHNIKCLVKCHRYTNPHCFYSQVTASSPRFLGISGIVILSISTALIVAGIATPARLQTSPPGASTPTAEARDPEGVPLDALHPPDPESFSECKVKLGDWQSYADAAAQAEQQAYGFQATNASPDVILAALRSLPSFQLNIRFWVLYSDAHTWSKSFIDAAALQTSILNAAFSGMKLGFNVAGVHAVPATNDEVEACGYPSKAPDGLISQLLAATDNATSIQIVVCDLPGSNGVTRILGGTGDGDGWEEGENNPLTQAIILRRGALWQSRTSLVHQIGHYLGLPHPFPDSKSCKYDGDTIVDTVQQYQGSTGCDVEATLPLCDKELSLEPEMLPIYNFMETSNDTCRRHFSAGQILRARAMLSVLRPELHAVASQGLQRLERMPWVRAFQSGVPSQGVLEQQLNAAAAAAGETIPFSEVGSSAASSEPLSLTPAVAVAGVRLSSALNQAAGAAGGSDGSIALDTCSCIGPNANGEAFWTGELDAAYFVDAVRVVQPWQVVVNTSRIAIKTIKAAVVGEVEPASELENGEEALARPPAEGHRVRGAATVSANAAPAPAPEGVPAVPAPPAMPAVEVRVGHSPLFWENKVCGNTTLPEEQLTQTVTCNAALPGRFITVRWTQQPEETGVMCLCDVAALSYTAPPLRPITAPPASIPGALLNVTIASAIQSSTKNASSSTAPSTAAAVALAGSSDAMAAVAAVAESPTATGAAATGGVTAGLSSVVCSSTLAEVDPWWSTTVSNSDLVWVRGVRLLTPNTCNGLSQLGEQGLTAAMQPQVRQAAPEEGGETPETEQESSSAAAAGSNSTSVLRCAPPGNITLDIFITSAALGAADSKELTTKPKDTEICVKGVKIAPGQVVDIDCGRPMQGRVITIIRRAASSLAAAAPLELCGVQPIGGVSLIGAEVVAAGMQSTEPLDLLPYLTLAVDGNPGTCIDASSNLAGGGGGSAGVPTAAPGGVTNSTGTAGAVVSWTAAFSSPVELVGLSVSGKASAAAGSGQLEVSLLDEAGYVVASLSTSGSGEFLAVDPPVVVASVKVAGFSSLCEVTFIAATGKALVSWSPGGSSSGEASGSLSAVAGGQNGGFISGLGLLETDFMVPPRPGWSGALSSIGGSSSDDNEVSNGNRDDGFTPDALYDGNTRTCTEIKFGGSTASSNADSGSSSGTTPAGAIALKIGLGGGNYQVPFVQLLGSTSGTNVTVSVTSSGSTNEISCGNGPLELQAWKVVGLECPADTTGDSLVITLLPPAAPSLYYGVEQVVGLCEIWVVGLTLVT